MNNNYKIPQFFLILFVNFYLFFVRIGVTRLPKVKGIFYYSYSRIKNKKGVIMVTTVDQNKLFIDLADEIVSTKLIQYGYWEKGLTTLAKKIVKPNMIVVDIGGHIGYYSVLFSKLVLPRGKVFAFEPEPHNFELLSKNIKINNINNCEIINKAVSSANGTIKLYLDADNLGAHSAVDTGHSKKIINVDTVTLDDYFENKKVKVDLIKMDIEGYEYAVLEGAKNILEKNKDIVVIMEFCPLLINKTNHTPESIIENMKSYGFHIQVIDHDSGSLEEVSSFDEIDRLCKVGLSNLLCSRNKIVI